MSNHPHPDVASAEELEKLPEGTFLEVAGRLVTIPPRPGDDPVEVAQAYANKRPWGDRFRLVTMRRFRVLAERAICGARGMSDEGVEVECSLEPHNDGVDHAGKVVLNGKHIGVHYWRGAPAVEDGATP
ncbi:hypothetical protein ACH41H_27925 [Streptomyces sp. NPDC020800]|uniref:hypothetical protein n=1 Tax=Streptomyces sp. NPDC020800 TaxID=3365092 RepID=UPI0037B4C28C